MNSISFGLIGENVSRSLSARIHARLGGYDYRLMSVDRAEAEVLLRSRAFDGLNVTMPYKRLALELCDEVSDTARAIGCVNTVVVRDGRMFGDNTDLFGFLSLARLTGRGFAGKKAVICGAGGTSLTVTNAALLEGAREVAVLSRSGPEGYEGAAERHADAEVLVNTTPLGMTPNVDAMPISPGAFRSLELALDVVYTPLRTRFVLAARRIGVASSGGLPMLVAQARRAAERFTGREIPDELSDGILRDLARETTDLVLIGMPGSGKSSIGHQVADALGRELIDIDEEVVRIAGRSIPEIFETDGEARFREIESEAIRAITARTPREAAVIATGGGAVCPSAPRPELAAQNADALRANGVVLLIRRDAASLPTEGRPISRTSDMEELARARAPHYEAASDAAIDNAASLGEAAEAAVAAFLSADIFGGGAARIISGE